MTIKSDAQVHYRHKMICQVRFTVIATGETKHAVLSRFSKIDKIF